MPPLGLQPRVRSGRVLSNVQRLRRELLWPLQPAGRHAVCFARQLLLLPPMPGRAPARSQAELNAAPGLLDFSRLFPIPCQPLAPLARVWTSEPSSHTHWQPETVPQGRHEAVQVPRPSPLLLPCPRVCTLRTPPASRSGSGTGCPDEQASAGCARAVSWLTRLPAYNPNYVVNTANYSRRVVVWRGLASRPSRWQHLAVERRAFAVVVGRA